MKTALIVLLVIFVLLLIPVSLRVKFDGRLEVFAGHLFSFKVYPPKKKKTRPKKSKKNKTDTSKKRKIKTSIEDVIGLVKASLKTLKKLLKCLRFKTFKLNITVSGSDAAKAAVNYGNVCMAISALYPVIEGKRKIKNADVSADLDYGGKTTLTADVTVTAILLSLLIVAISGAVLILKHLPDNKKKGGKDK